MDSSQTLAERIREMVRMAYVVGPGNHHDNPRLEGLVARANAAERLAEARAATDAALAEGGGG